MSRFNYGRGPYRSSKRYGGTTLAYAPRMQTYLNTYVRLPPAVREYLKTPEGKLRTALCRAKYSRKKVTLPPTPWDNEKESK